MPPRLIPASKRNARQVFSGSSAEATCVDLRPYFATCFQLRSKSISREEHSHKFARNRALARKVLRSQARMARFHSCSRLCFGVERPNMFAQDGALSWNVLTCRYEIKHSHGASFLSRIAIILTQSRNHPTSIFRNTKAQHPQP